MEGTTVKHFIRPIVFLFVLLVLIPSFSACSTWRKFNRTEKGAIIGGGTGAVIGSEVGGGAGGAVLGGAAGALGGGVIGHALDHDHD